MASVAASSGQGALFELVARGVKDTYFVKDDPSSEFPYDPQYDPSCAHLAERRIFIPINGSMFGGTFEVEIDAYGDVMTECALEVDLPTWLPATLIDEQGAPCPSATINARYPITAVNGDATYGYVNGIGYLLFERIQLYQDQFLLQEWSGDLLLARQMTEGSLCSQAVEFHQAAFQPRPSARDLALRATPGHLRVRLPLPGMQCPGDAGFPLVSMPHQTFRCKVTLRKLQDLIVCSDDTIMKPTPWSAGPMQYTDYNGVTRTFSPLSRIDIAQPIVTLSTIQHYVPADIQRALRTEPQRIPFRKYTENQFTFGELDYTPLNRGGTAAVTRRLDGRHPAERIFWFFRGSQAIDRNRLDDWLNSYVTSVLPLPIGNPASFYYRMKLLIAGRDREELHEPWVWEDLTALAKDENASHDLRGLGEMKWSIGDRYDTMYPAARQPEGTVNFSTADRPTIYLELVNVPSNALRGGQRITEMRIFVESWNTYVVEQGRGALAFAS